MSVKSSVKLEELGDAQRLMLTLFAQIGLMPITWSVEFGTHTRKVALNLHLPRVGRGLIRRTRMSERRPRRSAILCVTDWPGRCTMNASDTTWV
jgi:hypothetical protein